MPGELNGGYAITGETNLDELVSRYPRTAGVFIRRRMQCVGCEVARFETLEGASRIYGMPLEDLLAELRRAAFPPH